MHQAESYKPYNFIALSAESDSMPMEGSWLQGNLHLFELVYDLFPLTRLAFTALRDNLALTSAVVTVLLHLLVHSRPHLVHLNYSALALTGRTSLYILPAFTLTSLTASSPFMTVLDNLSLVNLL